jgi:hypothetical protein
MARHGAQTALAIRRHGVKYGTAMPLVLAIIGFVTGAAIAASTLALATELAQGCTFRDVVRRPVIRTWAAIYVAACGAAGAFFALNLASGNL